MDESLRHVFILDQRAAWLEGRQRNDTSQFGEDGLIEALFERIGETNRWCFEVGAADGLFYSNTKRLRDAGWSAVLIEAEQCHSDSCRVQFASERVHCVCERIGESKSLDSILADCGAPYDIDLGVIDIDGQDYWQWHDLVRFRPRLMLVEFAYFNDQEYVPARGACVYQQQAGLQSIINLGADKGYAAIVRTHCNVLFVDRQVWDPCQPQLTARFA